MTEPRHLGRDLVFDTNAVVHLFRRNALGNVLRSTYGLSAREWRPLLSAVTVGELRSLALQWGWDPGRMHQLDSLLRAFPVIDVYADEHSLCEAYAELDWAARRAGAKLGKNDLWIAATAKVRNAVVVSADQDFEALEPTGLISADIFGLDGVIRKSW